MNSWFILDVAMGQIPYHIPQNVFLVKNRSKSAITLQRGQFDPKIQVYI